MTTRLSKHELEILRRTERARRSRTPAGTLRRLLSSPTGNFLVNTPLFLLPKKVNLQAKHRVLEIGCGDGANLRFLAARIAFQERPVGLDLSARTLRLAGRAVEDSPFDLVAGTGSRLPFAGGSFDLVLVGHTLRFFSDEGFMRLLVEANRVLRPGGVLAVWEFAPAAEGGKGRARRWLLRRLGGYGRPRAYGDIVHWVTEARYDVVENPDLRPFLFPPLPRVSLLARKPPADAAPQTCENRPASP